MFLIEFLFVMLKLVEILAAQDILLHKSSSNISMILVISFLHPPPLILPAAQQNCTLNCMYQL